MSQGFNLVETVAVRVKASGAECVINASDFSSELHERLGAKAEEAQKKSPPPAEKKPPK